MFIVYCSERMQIKNIQGQNARKFHTRNFQLNSQGNCGKHYFPQQQCVTKHLEYYR